MASPRTYERCLTRVRDLEVDLASALSQLERTQNDSLALKDVHSDLVNTYRRLCDQHENLQSRMKVEQEEKRRMSTEHQEQLALWRRQLEAKAREFEEVHAQLAPQHEIDAIRLQIAEDIEGPYQQKMQALEGRIAVEQRKAGDAKRQAEVARIEASQREEELKEAVLDAQQKHKLQEAALERKITDLEGEVRHQSEAAGNVARIRAQVHDQGARLVAMQEALADSEQQHEETRKTCAEQLKAKVAEVSSSRRLAHEYSLQLEQEQRKCEQKTSEAEALKREVAQLTAAMAEMKATATATAREEEQRLAQELEREQREARAEKERLQRHIQDKDADLQKSVFDLRRTEARLEQQRETHAQQQHEALRDRQEVEARLQGDLESVRTDKDALQRELEDGRRRWRDREAALVKQVEELGHQLESSQDQVAQCQAKVDDVERSFRELQKANKDKETEMRSLRTEHQKLGEAHKEATEHKASLQATVEEHKASITILQAEISALSTRLDTEREKFTKESDEAQIQAQEAEEQRRNEMLKRAAEDHQRQFSKMQNAAKRTVTQSKKKQQSLKHKCQSLVQRVSQLQQEKVTALRICEENKQAYENRLREMSLNSRLGDVPVQGVLSEVSVLGTQHRRELRAIMERLEANAARVRQSSSPPIGRTGSASSEK